MPDLRNARLDAAEKGSPAVAGTQLTMPDTDQYDDHERDLEAVIVEYYRWLDADGPAAEETTGVHDILFALPCLSKPVPLSCYPLILLNC